MAMPQSTHNGIGKGVERGHGLRGRGPRVGHLSVLEGVAALARCGTSRGAPLLPKTHICPIK